MIELIFRTMLAGGLLTAALFQSTIPPGVPDAAGCRDHPLFPRLPGYRLAQCGAGASGLVIPLDLTKHRTFAAAPERWTYLFTSGRGFPGPLQLREAFSEEVLEAQGSILFEKESLLTARIAGPGREAWIVLELQDYGFGYTISLLESDLADPDLTAAGLWDHLSLEGYAVLPVEFEPEESGIAPGSLGLVDGIAALLQAHPDLKVSIEVHTDNVGGPVFNQSLSQRRARVLLAALLHRGVDRSRLQTTGRGQDLPRADNRTEEGRALNRRVEIVRIGN